MKLSVLRLYLLFAWGSIVCFSITAFMPQVTDVTPKDTGAYPLNISFPPLQQPGSGIDDQIPATTDPMSITVQCMDADLAVSKTGVSTHVNGNILITYTITVTNHGPDLATGVQVTDSLPANLAYGGHIASQGTYSNVSGIWGVNDLPKNAVATLLIITTLNGCIPGPQVISNIATVTSEQVDTIPANNVAQVDIEVDNPCGDVDLAITMSAKNQPFISLNAKDIVTYTITVTNIGSGTATGVVVTDILPANLTFEGYIASQGIYTPNDINASGKWVVGELTNNTSANLTITEAGQCLGGKTFIYSNAKISQLDQTDIYTGNNEVSIRNFKSQGKYCIYCPIIQCQPFFDTFDSKSNGWPIVDNVELKTEYVDSKYRMFTKNPRIHFAVAPLNYFTNYEIRVDAHWVNNKTGEGYGLVFGLNSNCSQAYVFQVHTKRLKYRLLRRSNDGWYYYSNNLWKKTTDDNKGWITPEDTNNPIHSNSTNTLKVIRNFPQIELYVNDSYLVTATDDIIKSGQFGLNVQSFSDQPNANALFDNYYFSSCGITRISETTEVGAGKNSSIVSTGSLPRP